MSSEKTISPQRALTGKGPEPTSIEALRTCEPFKSKRNAQSLKALGAGKPYREREAHENPPGYE